MQKKGVLLVISGPSGVGKGTVVEHLMEKKDYALSISATTRKPRDYEQEGIHYFFKEKEAFEAMIENKGFIEYACFCENYYGTPKAYVEEKMAQGVHVVLEIEVQGALQIKEHYPQAVLIFMVPPTIQDLKSRLEGRGTETLEVVQKRIQRATEEFQFIQQYDYLVINGDAKKAAEDIEAIVRSHGLKTVNSTYIIDQLKGEMESC